MPPDELGFHDQWLFRRSSEFAQIRQDLRREPNGFTNATLIQALQDFGVPAGPESFAWGEVFAEACRQAKLSELSALRQLFEQLPFDDYVKSLAFSDMADAGLRMRTDEKEIAKFWQPPTKRAALPPTLEKVPASLQDAWQIYEAASRKTERPKTKNSQSYQAERKKFWKVIEDLLAGRGGDWATKLENFHWGGCCGTGSGSFTDPQSRALLLAFVAENRLDDALAAALTLPRESFLMRTGPTRENAGLHFLQKSGIDWQSALIGGLISMDLMNSNSFQTEGSRQILLEWLVQAADDRGVQMLIEVAKRVPSDRLPDYFAALTAWVQPTGIPNGFGGTFPSAAFPRRKDAPVDEALQQEILGFLNDSFSKASSMRVAESLLMCLTDLRRPETIPVLSLLVGHPSETIAKKAADVLEGMGKKVEVPSKAPPVRYRISIDGKPAANFEIEWAAESKKGSVSSGAKTNDQGEFTLSGDYFIDPDRPVESLRLRSKALASPSDVWFMVNLPLPGSDAKATPVEVKTGAFSLLLSFPKRRRESSDLQMAIELQPEYSNAVNLWLQTSVMKLPIQDRVDFSGLSPGTYHLTIRVPGAGPWSGKVEVKPGGDFTVPLVEGFDVRFKLRLPEGWKPSLFQTDLRRDGEELPFQYANWQEMAYRGVPVGKYELHLLSSEELKGRGNVSADAVSFPGAKIRFEISPDSPFEIDLGEIQPGQEAVIAN